MSIATLAAAGIAFTDLGLSPVALDLGFFELRWYSLAYLAGIFLGYWYLLKLLAQPGAPMARRHADDLVFYASLGIIFGGRIGYVLFYNLPYYLDNPLDILKLWDGGMSFHGGVIGTSLGILYLARREGLQWLRLHDYVACTVPIGLGLVRIANFINGELWGRVADPSLPWAVIFPHAGDNLARHPSQIYQFLLEGLLLFVILWVYSRKPRAAGTVASLFLISYGLLRIAGEVFREPEALYGHMPLGLSAGQWLSVPMIVIGIVCFIVLRRDRARV